MTENKIVLPKESLNGKVIIDSKGRKITLKNPTMLDLYNFNKACRVNDKLDLELNNMAMALCYVDKIDGNPLGQMLGSMEILGNLSKFYFEDFDIIKDEIVKHQEGVKEEIKKS